VLPFGVDPIIVSAPGIAAWRVAAFKGLKWFVTPAKRTIAASWRSSWAAPVYERLGSVGEAAAKPGSPMPDFRAGWGRCKTDWKRSAGVLEA
jgi:hypothetical protein